MLPSPVGEPSRQSTRNPISLRLYKVLATNYDDPSTREALLSVSKFYSIQDSDNASGVPTKHGELAARARKNLRRDLESRLAAGSRQFLDAFKTVDEKLSSLELLVTDMHSRYDEADAQLQKTTEACTSLLARANSLRLERKAIQNRQSIASLFLQNFTLTPEEIEALTSRETPVRRTIFEALDRTEKIRENCALLLAGNDEDNRAGLDIMSQAATYLDQGYTKLQRYCANEFKRPAGDVQVEVSPDLQTAVRYLGKRPDLLEEVLVELAESRRTSLLQSFLIALTRGGPDGMPRPIEFHAHDPVRYVGDMLAWVHQAIAWENEYFESLFSVNNKTRMMGSIRVFDPNAGDQRNEDRWIRQLMDSDVEGLCKPLKLRVSQTIKSQDGGVTAYKIRNLLYFYHMTLSRTIGSEALLSRVLYELADLGHNTFIAALQSQGRSLLRFLHPPDSDLAPPLALIDAAQLLKEMMAVYESSAGEEEEDSSRASGFKGILDASIDPIIEMCRKMANLLSSKDDEKDTWDRNVFLANCFTYLQAILHPFRFASERLVGLEKSVLGCVEALVEHHRKAMLVDSGLGGVALAIESKPSGTPLSHTVPSATVSQALQRFSNFLSSLDVVSSPRLALLTAPQLSHHVHREALRGICDAYSKICSAIKDPANKYEFASTLLGGQRPFGQLRTLYQIFGLEETKS